MPSTPFDSTALQDYLDANRHQGRSLLLPALHKAQSEFGWLPREVLELIGMNLRVPLADIHGVVEFYSMFYNQPTSTHVVRVCEDPACDLAGAEQLIDRIQSATGLAPHQTSPDHRLTFERVPCLGMCDHAPVGLAGEQPAGPIPLDGVDRFLDGSLPEPKAQKFGSPFWLLQRVGEVDPKSLESYLEHNGYLALNNALGMRPEELIETIHRAGISGRGGAMFPFGQKLKFTRGAPGNPSEKHIVVNADESEPGTFKDRVLLEEDPFSIIESATLAAYAAGAENGWIFVRGEYPKAFRLLEQAADQARAAGYLGRDILGQPGFNFDIQVRLGAGAYICGEETALFEAIEGKRGFPRIKPPFPTTHGLFNQPTAVNNVETLVAGLIVMQHGLNHWLAEGTEASPGTKLFCLSGHVKNPGIYEVPFGLTIADLIDLAGGEPHGKDIQAVLMGGAAGIF
ncbi:MAG: NAD(P)H-dependent oxidoreductase subunit E, partial [Anaerolineales bacterium]|nr:NAD(P)H-dependent oxidoreductase subunit E [Anaerolineales bacterium]